MAKSRTHDGLGSSILPNETRGASQGKGLPYRTHAIHVILFHATLPMMRSEIEQQLTSWGYDQITVNKTEEHLNTLRKGLRKNKIIAAVMDNQGKYSLTVEGRKRLASGPFSDVLKFDDDPPLQDAAILDVNKDFERQNGAGFGDAAENKVVELAAIREVKKAYEDGGWLVRTVEREKCGFDLVCSKKAEVENVEVKGVKGMVPSFTITAGELNQAQTNAKFFLIVVTSALSSSPKLTKFSGEEFCRRYDFNAVQYRAIPKP